MRSFLLTITFLTSFIALAQPQKAEVYKLVQNLKSGEYERVIEALDSSLMDKASPYDLKLAWENLVKRYGPYQDTIDFVQEESGFSTNWKVGVAFEKDSADLVFHFNSKHRLTGFAPRPYSLKIPYELPGYAKAKDFSEIPFVLESKGFKLPGILTLSTKSKGKSALVILAHGSGANTKDEFLGPNPIFKDIAYGLASKGIATFRYDKRSLVYRNKMCANPDSFTVWEEVLEDILSAVDTFSSDERFEGVFVLGHSLSAYLVPRVAENRPQLSGIISAAGPARPLQTLVLEQYNYLQSIADDPDDWIYTIKQLKRKVEFLESDEFGYDADAQSLPLELPAAYYMDLKNYDPVQTALKAAVPLLVLQGKKDYQVVMADYERWKSGLTSCKKCQFKVYDKLGHGLFEGADVLGPKQYETVDHVNKAVIQDIAKFIKSNRP
ncbi:MAG: alpha/beta fold hydrolase [Bacteroidetes bacterium]|nr:MAG: alpha/beta fold hydrolase [Bacteroidota bacterium]